MSNALYGKLKFVAHAIDGNDVDRLREARDELQR